MSLESFNGPTELKDHLKLWCQCSLIPWSGSGASSTSKRSFANKGWRRVMCFWRRHRARILSRIGCQGFLGRANKPARTHDWRYG